MARLVFSYLCILFLVILFSCQPKKEKPNQTLFSARSEFLSESGQTISRERIRRYLSDSINNVPQRTLCDKLTARFYQADSSFLWLGNFRIESQTDSLLAYLENSARHGLNPERFRLSNIRNDLKKLNNLDFGKGENINRLLARLEYNLTRAYLQYACGMNFGFINPRRILNNLEIEEGIDGEPKRLPNGGMLAKELYATVLQSCDTLFVTSALNAALQRDAAAFIRKAVPSGKTYTRLQAELERMDKLAGEKFPPIPLIGDSLLKPGDKSRIVPLVTQRLKLTGEFSLDDRTSFSDQIVTQELLDAVNRFREANNLPSGQFLGNLTIKALNRPPVYYTDRLRINLERLRWKPKLQKGSRYVTVNIASAMLRAVDSQADTTLEMKVCVGNKKNKTPLLSSLIRYVEMNPYWNVPQSIIMKEIIPAYRKDTAYFTRHKFKVYDKEGKEINPQSVDWSKYREGVPFDVKQDNKEGNALGRMIFRFPNTHSVYLHDTPAKYGFRLSNRAISHGCVRLEKPLGFTYFLIGKEDKYTRDRIRMAIGLPALSEQGQKIEKKEGQKELEYYSFNPPVSLFMEYNTVFISEKGRLTYCEDTYGYDPPLLEALDKQVLPASKNHPWNHSTKKN